MIDVAADRDRRQRLDDVRVATLGVVVVVLGVVWQTLRLVLCVGLGILEPFFRVVLVGLAVLAVIVAPLFEFSGVAPRFPFWGMMGFAAGSVGLLALYYLVLRALSR
jgi:hypothetical protein